MNRTYPLEHDTARPTPARESMDISAEEMARRKDFLEFRDEDVARLTADFSIECVSNNVKRNTYRPGCLVEGRIGFVDFRVAGRNACVS